MASPSAGETGCCGTDAPVFSQNGLEESLDL
jgi:hypothetical protein